MTYASKNALESGGCFVQALVRVVQQKILFPLVRLVVTEGQADGLRQAATVLHWANAIG